MKKLHNRWQYFAAAAALIAALIFLLVITGGGSGILLDTGRATACVDRLMAAAQQGDLEQAAQYLYGTVTVQPNEEVTPLDSLHRDYLESITWSLGKCYTQDDALLLDVQVTHMDLFSYRTQYEAAVQQALEAYGEDIDDSWQVFEAVARDAMAAIRPGSIPTATEDLTLRLVHADGQWLCVPSAELVDLLCGKY